MHRTRTVCTHMNAERTRTARLHWKLRRNPTQGRQILLVNDGDKQRKRSNSRRFSADKHSAQPNHRRMSDKFSTFFVLCQSIAGANHFSGHKHIAHISSTASMYEWASESRRSKAKKEKMYNFAVDWLCCCAEKNIDFCILWHSNDYAFIIRIVSGTYV